VDGFRLDHAHGPPLLFWTQFRERTRREKPDSYTVGEVTLSPGGLQWYEGRLDGCLDFPLLAAFRQFFIHGTIDAATFHAFLQAGDHFYGLDFSRPTFLDNHDMNRFLWLAGNDTRILKLAAACQLALPQPPIVYYGTEIGMSQERDVSQNGFEAARLPMDWEHQQPGVLQFYRRLIHLRREHPALRTGTRRALATRERFYAFLCEAEGERIVVALNATDSDQSIELPGVGGVELQSAQAVPPILVVGPMKAALVLVTG
jgi:glycosidase